MLRLLLVSALFVLTACATSHRVAENAPIRTVAIIVAFPEQLHLHYQRLFDVVREDVPIDWRINDRVAGSLKKALSGHYELIELPYRREQIIGAMKYNEILVGTDNSTAERIQQMIAPGAADAIVVVQALMNVVNQGAHMAQVKNYYSAGIGYRSTVLDGRTFKPMAAAFGSVAPAPHQILASRASPTRRIGFSWGGESFRALPEGAQKEVRDIVEEMIDSSVPYTLNRVGLI